jgi:hypothetical protein
LFIYYFLLNEEVRKFLKESKKKNKHTKKDTIVVANLQDFLPKNKNQQKIQTKPQTLVIENNIVNYI